MKLLCRIMSVACPVMLTVSKSIKPVDMMMSSLVTKDTVMVDAIARWPFLRAFFKAIKKNGVM